LDFLDTGTRGRFITTNKSATLFHWEGPTFSMAKIWVGSVILLFFLDVLLANSRNKKEEEYCKMEGIKKTKIGCL
jgi:hypothetical protein